MVIKITKTLDFRRLKTFPVSFVIAFNGILYDLNDEFWNEEEKEQQQSVSQKNENIQSLSVVSINYWVYLEIADKEG